MFNKKGFFLLSLILFTVIIGLATVYAMPAAPRQFMGAALNATGGSPVGSIFTVSGQTLEEMIPAIAYNPDRQEYLAVWYNDRAGNDDIQAQRLSKDGAKLGGAFYVAAGAGADRRNPDIAYNSAHGEYMVVYDYETSSKQGIRGVIVPGNGSSVGTEITFLEGSSSQPYHTPAIAYASTADRYLITTIYFDLVEDRVLAGSYEHDGTRDGLFVALSHQSGKETYPIEKPELAYNRARNEFLVIWQQQFYENGSSKDKDIFGRRVKMSGGMDALGDPFAISDDAGEESNPTIAALPNAGTEGRYLVVFEYDAGGSAQGLRGQAVEGTGGAGFLITFPYAASSDPQHYPAVAASETASRFLVTWQQEGYAPPLTYNGIVGRAVSNEGVLLGDSLNNGSFALGGITAEDPAVAAGANGDFMVIFDDQELLATNRDIFGQLWGNRVYLPLVVKN